MATAGNRGLAIPLAVRCRRDLLTSSKRLNDLIGTGSGNASKSPIQYQPPVNYWQTRPSQNRLRYDIFANETMKNGRQSTESYGLTAGANQGRVASNQRTMPIRALDFHHQICRGKSFFPIDIRRCTTILRPRNGAGPVHTSCVETEHMGHFLSQNRAKTGVWAAAKTA